MDSNDADLITVGGDTFTMAPSLGFVPTNNNDLRRDTSNLSMINGDTKVEEGKDAREGTSLPMAKSATESLADSISGLEQAKGPVNATINETLDAQFLETGNAPNVINMKMTKFTLYEAKTRMYIVGSNSRESRFRILEIDLTGPKDVLNISETKKRYTRAEVMEALRQLEEDNHGNGFRKRLTACGLIGFTRFTNCYYMSVVTKRSAVALIGGHFIYHIDGYELIPLVDSATYKKPDRRSDEARLLATFQTLDLSKTFYFSYSYDITHTLQHNMIREKERALGLLDKSDYVVGEYHEMYVWNHFLLKPVLESPNFAESESNVFDWFMPIIHGFVDQAKISDYGRDVLVTIIARRSHYFAGARFLKRGVNDQGNVANEVETEQIVSDYLTTSFHNSRDGIFNSPRYTSFVQHRGSIPLFWSQDASNMSPKPPIGLTAVDPFFSAAALHFDDMFSRYGSPVMVLNLIKTKERTPRETILGKEFEACIAYLNQFLPQASKVQYTAWDMSRASKGRDQEVIDFLEKYAETTLKATGFFHNGKNIRGMKIQDGICRSNCIDCLDRTNAAQFVIAKKALAYQLHALGLIGNDLTVDYDSDAVNLLTEMYHDHGDTIALQYGGSHLVNTMETYRKINQWTSHSRDMIESLRRFYSNSFVDSQRQEAINLFLGNYVWQKDKPALWELPTDHFLHNSPSLSRSKYQRSYRKWWIPYNIKSISQRLKDVEAFDDFEDDALLPYEGFNDNYWNEGYRPRLLSSLHLNFAYNINSTSRYLPITTLKAGDLTQLSPFKSRKRRVGGLDGNSRVHTETTNPLRDPRARQKRTEKSIQRTALKRASLIYQNPLPKIISERVFSGGRVPSKSEQKAIDEKQVGTKSDEKVRETNRSSTGSGSLTPSSGHSNLSLDMEAQISKSLAPEVEPADYEHYTEYTENVPDIVHGGNEIEADHRLEDFTSYMSRTPIVDEKDFLVYEEAWKQATESNEQLLGDSYSDMSGPNLGPYTKWITSGHL